MTTPTEPTPSERRKVADQGSRPDAPAADQSDGEKPTDHRVGTQDDHPNGE